MEQLFEKQDALLNATSMDIESPRGNKLPLWMLGMMY